MSSEITYLSPHQLARLLTDLIPTGVPVWVHGKPGCGKTSIVQQVARALDYECPPFPPAVTLDPVDLRGVPWVDKERRTTLWAPPYFWPRDPEWRGVIFVDELPQADKSVQSCFLQLTYGGQLGDYVLPREATFVVCGNRQEDRAGVQRVITPLLNRFVHLGLETSLEDWRVWASLAGVHPLVRSYLAFKPADFDTFDPTLNQVAFASPRSWERAGQVYAAVRHPDLLHAAVAGCVGPGPAAGFTAFAEIWSKLPDPHEVLKDPQRHPVPREPSVAYALAGALAEAVRSVDDTGLLANFVAYCERLPVEYGTLALRDAVQTNKKILPLTASWLRKHREVFLGAPQ